MLHRERDLLERHIVGGTYPLETWQSYFAWILGRYVTKDETIDFLGWYAQKWDKHGENHRRGTTHRRQRDLQA